MAINGRPLAKSQKPQPLSNKVKYLTCAAVFYGNIGLALVCHVHGPALTSFQKKYDTDDATISIVFSLMTAGISTGALLSGILFRYVNRQLATIIVFGGMSVCMFTLPFCPDLTSFFIMSTLMGFFGGFYSSAQFTWILEMMQSKCPPYVIAEHFFYALGIIVASLLLAPFLGKEGEGGLVVRDTPKEGQGQGQEQGQYEFPKFRGSEISDTDAVTDSGIQMRELSEGNHLIIPFTVMSIILLLSMVFQLILYIFFRYHAPPPEETKIANEKDFDTISRRSSIVLHTGMTNLKDVTEYVEDTEAAESEPLEQPRWKRMMKRLLLIIYIGVFCGSFKGMEDNVVAFLPKFAQNGPLHMSESKSAYLLSASMFSYTLARFCGIFVVYKVPPRGLLLFNMALTIFCNILMMTVAQDNETVLWATSVLFGIAFSTAYGCFSSYLERYLHVTDAVGAFVLVYGAGIAAAYPVLIGAYIEKFPVILPYTSWISIIICSAILIVSGIQTRYDKKRY